MIDYNRIFFDTAPFIFFLEKNSNYFDKMRLFIDKICEHNIGCVTSAVTIEEYCVLPYRDNDNKLLEQFNNFIKDMEIDIIDINRKIAEKASRIRASYKNFKGMDAL